MEGGPEMVVYSIHSVYFFFLFSLFDVVPMFPYNCQQVVRSDFYGWATPIERPVGRLHDLLSTGHTPKFFSPEKT